MFGEATLLAVASALVGVLWKMNSRLTRLETRQESFNDFIVEILARILPDGHEVLRRYVSYHRSLAGKSRAGIVPATPGPGVVGGKSL